VSTVFATIADLATWLRDHDAEIRIKRVDGHGVVKIETGDPTTGTHVATQGSSLTDALALAAIDYEAAVLAKQTPTRTVISANGIPVLTVRGGKK
jgi:rRNA-processing protein FCF1